MVAVRIALALALLGASGWAGAAADAAPGAITRPIDAAQSQVQFQVRKFWFAHVRGTFPDLSGTLRRINTHIDADLVRVDATLQVAGLEMDDAGDREHALGVGFFDAEQFPTIQFESDPFPWSDLVKGAELHGILDLRGERHPVTLVLQPSDCPLQPLQCVIRLRGNISRSRFGMRGWRGVLSDKVTLDLRIRLAPTPSS